MAGRLNMVFLAAIAIAVLVQNSAAQTTHTVGDSTGWTIPQGGASFYSSWAANKSFSVGDILVFNFPNGAHDVAKVTKADYDACASTNPISVVTLPPARIPINASGEHYFICNFPGHCSAGQKLMINVRAGTSSPSPAPQPSSPAPRPSSPSPTPVPSSAPQPSSPSPTPVPSSAPRPSSPAPQPSSPSQPPVPSSGPSTPPASGPSPPSPSPGPSSTTTPPPPGGTAPPPSSAPSLGVSGLLTGFLAISVALLY